MQQGPNRHTTIKNLLISIFIGLIISLAVLYTWKLSLNESEYENIELNNLRADIIAQEVESEIQEEIDQLIKLKNRLVMYDGFSKEAWDFESELIFDQLSSVVFLQWLEIGNNRTIYSGPEALSEIELADITIYDEMISRVVGEDYQALSMAGRFYEIERYSIYILDFPIFIDVRVQSILSAGIDFDKLLDALLRDNEAFYMSLYDQEGNNLYQFGSGLEDLKVTLLEREFSMGSQIDEIWKFQIAFSHSMLVNTGFQNLQLNLILGLMLSLLMAIGIYFILGFYSAKKAYDISNSKLRAVIKSSPLAIYSINKKGIVKDFWNPAAEKIFGYKAKNVMGQYLPDITRESAEEYQEMIHQVLKKKKYASTESTRVKPDGTNINVRVYAGIAQHENASLDEILVMVEDITQQKEIESELNHEKQVSDTILKSQPGLFYLIDEKRQLVRWNKNVNEFFDKTDKELEGMNFLELFVEEERLKVLEGIQNVSYKGHLEIETVVKSNGELYDFYINGTLLKLGKRLFIVGNGINITERNKIRNDLQRSLDEKEVLLSEIHHRVKNNLAIISNLIDIQLMDIADHTMTDILRETQNRIYSIAGVHEMLYDVKNFYQISFKNYLKKLFDRIFALYNDKNHLTNFDLMVKVEYLNINQAIPLGLLLTELITNSFKHGFTSDHAGLITIEITGSSQLIHVDYQDNGVGFKSSVFETSTSMGFVLVKSLLRQLGAEYSVSDKAGFQISLSFTTKKRGAHSTLN